MPWRRINGCRRRPDSADSRRPANAFRIDPARGATSFSRAHEVFKRNTIHNSSRQYENQTIESLCNTQKVEWKIKNFRPAVFTFYSRRYYYYYFFYNGHTMAF